MSKVVVFGDGRTSYLNYYVQKRNNMKIEIVIKDEPGAGIRGCISSAYQHVFERPYDICVIMAGAQDMLRYNNITDRYFFPYQSTEEFTDYVTSVYQ